MRSRAKQQLTPDVVAAPVQGDETQALVALLRQRRADLRNATLPWSQVDKDLAVIDLRVKLRALNGATGSGVHGPASVKARVDSSASTASDCMGCVCSDTSNHSTSDDDNDLGSSVACNRGKTDDDITIVVSDVIDSNVKRAFFDLPLTQMRCPPPRSYQLGGAL